MKVLLDTNIWRYIADADAFSTLKSTASDTGIEIVVAPVLVNEVRQFKDNSLRKKILSMIASPSMVRLMPEAYLEAEEIRRIFEEYRPDWLVQDPDFSEISRLKVDWESLDQGFWSRAEDDISPPDTNESERGKLEHELAQRESKEIRHRMVDEKAELPSSLDLKDVYGNPPVGQPGFRGDPVEYWRIPSLYHFQAEFEIYTSPYRHWLDCIIDVAKVKARPDSLTELWYYQVSGSELPRQWIRGAFEFLQSYHKVTPGTPIDSQLSSHLTDVDVVMSADKNLIRFVRKCRNNAPFSVAQECLISGGSDGVAGVLSYMHELR